MAAEGNIQIPDVFESYLRLRSAELAPFLQTRAINRDTSLIARLNAAGGATVSVPFWKELAQDAVNRDKATTATAATPKAITTGVQSALAISDNQSWLANDFRSTIAGDDEMEAILEFTAPYWAKQYQARAIAIMTGVFADNDSADGSDMTVDLRGAFADGGTQFTASAFISAKQTMGDRMNNLSTIWTHSVVAARMENLQLISFLQGNIDTRVGVWNGHTVIIDDSMPMQNTADGADYETWIFGDGALGFAQGNAKNPVMMDRDELAYNGAGADILTTRTRYMIVPRGYSWTGSLVEGNAPADTVLDDAASWDRVYPERKQCPFARLRTTESAQIT